MPDDILRDPGEALVSSDKSEAVEAVAWPPAARAGSGQSPALRYALTAAKILVSVGALYLAFRAVDFRLLWGRLGQIDLPLFAVVVIAAMVQVALVSLRWRLIVDRLDPAHSTSPRSALAITFSAQFVNQFLPFAAGDALRAVLISRAGKSARTAVTGVLIDRGVGLLVLFVIALPPLLLSQWRAELPALSQALLALVVAVLAAFALTLALAPRIVPLLLARRPTWPLGAALEDLARIFRDPRTAAAIALLSAVVHILSVAIVWTLSYVVATPAPLLTLWILVPPMLLATMLPFTVSGWGARESVVVAFLAAAGIPAEGALLLSVAFGAALLVSALPGAVAWLGFVRRPA